MKFLDLSEREQLAVKEVSAKIDLQDAGNVSQYGEAARKSAASFTGEVLKASESVTADVADAVEDLLAVLDSVAERDTLKKKIFDFFRKKDDTKAFLRRCTSARENVKEMSLFLEEAQLLLTKNIEILEQMYVKSVEFGKMLGMYILSGKMKLQRERETTLANLREIVRRTELPQDIRAAEEFEDKCRVFEGRLAQLENIRFLCLEIGPQIRILQSGGTLMADKMKTAIVNVIPAWLEQMSSMTLRDGQVPNADAVDAVNAGLTAVLEELLQAKTNCHGQQQRVQGELQRIADSLALRDSDARRGA